VEITGVPTSTLYLKISQGAFPAPVKIGPRAVAWRASDIAAWLDALKPREVAK
jgi:prophage regulatory protein